MQNTDYRPITLTPLSPIHIGCDEDYVPTNFVIQDNLLHYLDMTMLADLLEDDERRKLGENQTIGAIQYFFKSRRDRFAPLAHHIVGIASDIAQEYETKAGRPVQSHTDGNHTYNLFPISRTSYRSLDLSPYLPGSSLKGSIRTAWLEAINQGRPLLDAKENNQALQQRLLGYSAGQFENDPLRHLHVADAHHEEDPAPTHILYAVSKKKRPSEHGTPELKVFLETIPGLLSDAFSGEIRIRPDNKDGASNLTWQHLCDVCNAFYWPQLEAELDHTHLAKMLDPAWRQVIQDLLREELAELRAKQQGFLLRVGKHSGAESVTLDVVRDIKILGKKGAPPSYRKETTEKRFASERKDAANNLLPFGWLWVESCQDAYQYLSIAMRDRLRPHTLALREAQQNRLEQIEQARKQRDAARQAAEQKRLQAEQTARLEAAAAQAKATELAKLSENMRQIVQLRDAIDKRLVIGQKIPVSDHFFGGHIMALVQQALASQDWNSEERNALAAMLEERASKLINLDAKDFRKKLKLAALRGQA